MNFDYYGGLLDGTLLVPPQATPSTPPTKHPTPRPANPTPNGTSQSCEFCLFGDENNVLLHEFEFEKNMNLRNFGDLLVAVVLIPLPQRTSYPLPTIPNPPREEIPTPRSTNETTNSVNKNEIGKMNEIRNEHFENDSGM